MLFHQSRGRRSPRLSCVRLSLLLFIQIIAALGEARAAPPAIRSDGTILVDGNPYFPFGFYIGTNGIPLETVKSGLAEMGAAGFTAAHVYMASQYGSRYGEALGVAESYGMELLGQPYQFSSHFPRHSASLGWMVADDAEAYAPSQVASLRLDLKLRAPDALAYIANSSWVYKPTKSLNIADYIAASDITALQEYPIPKGANSNYNLLGGGLPEVYAGLKRAVDAADPQGKPVLANLQTFAWGLPGSRFPTASEVDNMTYQALVAGVRGVLYFTFHNASTRVKEHPAVWEQTKKLAVEMRELAPVLLNGARTTVKLSDTLVAAHWVYEGRLYVVAVNSSSTLTQQVTLPLPGGAWSGALAPLFPSRPQRLSVTGGAVSGSLPPEGIEVLATML